MKTIRSYYVTIGLMALFASCKGGSGDYDASGVFETTEVTVSARGTGEIMREIMRFDIEEGYQVEAGQAVGYIDTIQLHLKKEELLGNLMATDSRRYNVSRQIASLRQEIATQKRRKRRIKSNWMTLILGSPYSRSGSRRRWRLWRTATGA